jgi:hypothetical protein
MLSFMKHRAWLLALVPAVLLLSACTPGSPAPDASQPEAASSSASPSAEAEPVTPTVVDPADYITDGAVGTTDEAWQVTYSFYTDSSKSVLCAFDVNSETPSSAYCWVVTGNESSVTYNVPPAITAQCDQGSADYTGDGYEVGIGVFQQIGVDAGFVGCRELESTIPAVVSASKVIPDNSTISAEELTCTVEKGIATCGNTTPGSTTTFAFGLSVAQFTF